MIAPAQIETGTAVVDGIATFYRRIAGEGPPAVLVHGNPTHSEDWLPFLERMHGPALAFDLPGLGRSARSADFDHSMQGYARFVGRFLDWMDVGRYSLAVHDWGSVAIIAAQREPSRVERLVVIDAVPLTPGYRWHRMARIWRTPVLGELSNLLWSRRALEVGMRESRGDWGDQPPEFVDMIWDHLDRGSFRAILELYRSAPAEELAAAGRDLDSLKCPALVIWGRKDRYLDASFGRAFAERLPDSELWELPDAGHWPWLEDPRVVDRVVSFLEPDA